MSLPLENIPYRLRNDVFGAGRERETRCAICGGDGEGLGYCPDHIADGLADKDAAIRSLRHRLTSIHQLCEQIQAIGSEPPAKGGSHSAQFGRTLALVRDIDLQTVGAVVEDLIRP